MNTEASQVLIVDSEKDWLDFASTTLREADYQVATASSPDSARAILNALGDALQHLITLVDFDTLTQDRWFLSALSDRCIPAVVLYAVDPPLEELGSVFQQGAFDCVGKPYDEDQLVALVDQSFAAVRLVTNRRELLVTSSGTVLVIDDDPTWLKTLVDSLPTMARIDTATSRTAAEKSLTEQSYDLVICDLRLAENDESNYEGLYLMSLLRELDHARGRFTQVIVSSGHGTPVHIRESYRNYGACYYVDKHKFSPVRYRDAIRNALSGLRVVS